MARWDRRTRLTSILSMRDDTRRGLASASRGFQGYLSGMNRNAGMAGQALSGALSGHAGFAAAGMGAAFLGFAGDAISSFIRLEKQWAEVTTLLPQLNEAALKQMKSQIDQFARETGTSLEDAYSATYQAISAGVSPEQSAEFLRVAQKAALAGVTDITTAVDGLTSALNAYGLEIEDAAGLSDDMFTAVKLGKTTFPELASNLGMVMPIAASLNVEFRELTAASAALTAQGNTQAMATTQIRSALIALSKDTEAKNMFETMTGMTFSEFQAQGGTMQQAFKMIVDEADRTGQSLVQLFGRQEGAQAALALSAETGAQTFAEGMLATAGATDAAYQRMEKTTDHRLKVIGAHWEGFKTTVGKAMTDIGTGMVGWVHDLQSIWGGHTIAEKEAMAESEENWRKYAVNVSRTQMAHAEWARRYTASIRASVRLLTAVGPEAAALRARQAGLNTRLGLTDPFVQHGGGFDAPTSFELSAGYLGLPQDWEGGIPPAETGGGGRATSALESIALSNRELVELMRSGEALNVRLDANVDEGVVLRADTVRRDIGQVSARMGNMLVNRKRSG